MNSANSNNILNKISNVNAGQNHYSSFIKLIEEDKEEEIKLNQLNRLIPDIHQPFVKWIIEKQFGNNIDRYIKTIPLFFKLFSKKDKLICDQVINSKDLSRKRFLKKKKKHLILYSAQLLKLIGFGRSKIATTAIVENYRNEMKEQDEFLKNFRLINASGKITKLVSNEKKQKQKIAQILKISKCFEDIAKDKKFTFSFITLTLPSSFHPLPKNKNENSFDGKTPGQAIEQINNYWKLIRARLSNLGLKFGDNLFGIQVTECCADSTLHLHCALWHSKEDTEDIHDEIKNVAKSSSEFVRFDIQLNNGKAKASTYLFKYVLKTHSTYSDENKGGNAVKNMACRNLYGIRSFNFFGIKGSITKFNFLCKHYKNYKRQLSKEIKYCLEQGDLYDFITNYEMYFENSYIKENSSKKLLGVIFKKGIYEYDNNCEILKNKDIIKYNEIVFIRNIQYSVFEKTFENEIADVNKIDLTDEKYANVKQSFDKVCIRQKLYDDEINEVILRNNFNLNNSVQLYNIIQEKTEDYHYRDYRLRYDEYDMQEII